MNKKITAIALTFAFVFSATGFTFAQESTSQDLTPEDTIRQIQELKQVVSQLQKSYTAPTLEKPTACMTIASFNRNLSLGSRGADIKCLQALLNTDSQTQISVSGPGSKGQETEYFGSLTKTAVIKFQNKYSSEILAPVGLTTGTGFVGPSTRAKLNAILTATPGQDEPSEFMKKLEEIIEALNYLSEKVKELEDKDDDDEEEDPYGELSCYSFTENSIRLSYSFEEGDNVSLFRGNTRIETWTQSNRSGRITDTGLSPDTSYTYYLRNGRFTSSERLARAVCRTKFQDEEKTREDCIKDIEDVEKMMKDRMSGENDEEPIEIHMKCGNILVYKSPLASGMRFLKNRGWEEIKQEVEWMGGEEKVISQCLQDIEELKEYEKDMGAYMCPEIARLAGEKHCGGLLSLLRVQCDYYGWDFLEERGWNYVYYPEPDIIEP